MTRQSSEPPSAGAGDYFLEVESHFASRRGTPFIFSAKDWALLKSWKEEGVPLPVVLEAIDSCFEKREKSGRRGTISSLSYCRHAVQEIWSERRDLHVGGEGSVPERDPTEVLRRLSGELESVAAGLAEEDLARLIRSAVREIEGWIAPSAVPELEGRLMRLEEDLLEKIEGALSGDIRSALDEQVERELGRFSFPDPETRESTRRANLRRLVRARLSLPRLTLFG
ncbi:MAG TPA: hypothetical protein VM534_09700 [Thermoanaerobaculia bacterium]|nr:hypothetical protein [Thermoanaerobaculia bacterium]